MTTKLSSTSAVIKIIVSTLGTGILYMPYCFNAVGYYQAMFMLAYVSAVTAATLYMLSYGAIAAECCTDASYPRIASLFSPALSVFVDVAMIGSNIGSCVFIVITQLDEISKLLSSFGFSIQVVNVCRMATLVVVCLLVAYFGTKKSPSSLFFISNISFMSVIYYLALITYYCVAFGKPMSELSGYVPASSGKISEVFLRFIFSLHCQFSFYSIFKQINDQGLSNIKFCSYMAGIGLFIVYGLSGFIGYKAVGEEIGDMSILRVFNDPECNFIKTIKASSFDTGAYLPRLAVSLFIFIWFGFLCFATSPCITIIHDYIAKGKDSSRIRDMVSAAIALFLFITGLALETKDLNFILDLVTALFTNPLSFFFPAAFMYYSSPSGSKGRVMSYFIGTFSVSLAVKLLFDTAMKHL